MNYPHPRVRVATEADEEALVHLCAALNAEIGLFAPDFAKIRMQLREAYIPPVEQRPAIIGIISGDRGCIEGAIYLQFIAEWYSTQLFVHELFNFVHPEFRAGTNNSHELISWAKMISDTFGYPLLIGVLSSERTEAKARHYRRHLGQPIGHTYGYNFNLVGGI